MPSMQHPTEEQRERRAAASAGLVRRVVEEACNQGDLAVLDALLAGPTRSRRRLTADAAKSGKHTEGPLPGFASN